MGNRCVHYFDCGDDFSVCTYAKTYQTIYALNICSLLYVNYTSTKLFLRVPCTHFSPILTMFEKADNILFLKYSPFQGSKTLFSWSISAIPCMHTCMQEAAALAVEMRLEFSLVDF